MNDIWVRGTTNLDEIAVVVALLGRTGERPSAPLDGLHAWRARRLAALACRTHGRTPAHLRSAAWRQ